MNYNRKENNYSILLIKVKQDQKTSGRCKIIFRESSSIRETQIRKNNNEYENK